MFNLMRHRDERHTVKSQAVASSVARSADPMRTAAEARDLLRRFNPLVIGFGIVDLHGNAVPPEEQSRPHTDTRPPADLEGR